MRVFLIRWFIGFIVLMIVVKLISGISVDTWQTAALAALLLGLVNAFLRPLIILFTMPLNIISFGLFAFVINAFLLYLVSKLITGFYIADFWAAFWGALLFSIMSGVFNVFIGTSAGSGMHVYRHTFGKQQKKDNIIDIEAEVQDQDNNKNGTQ